MSSSLIEVPLIELLRTADVNVLLVRVSVVALPTNVSVLVGNVRVPVLVIELITGDVSVLLVKVSVVALPTNVSVALGNVTVMSAVASGIANVVSKASAVAPSNSKEPP